MDRCSHAARSAFLCDTVEESASASPTGRACRVQTTEHPRRLDRRRAGLGSATRDMREETHESRHSRLLELRNAELAAQHTVGEFYIVGGVVMCIALDARDASLTIDAFFKPAKLVREAAARVAAASRISDKWLNDAVKPVRPESVPTPSPSGPRDSRGSAHAGFRHPT